MAIPLQQIQYPPPLNLKPPGFNLPQGGGGCSPCSGTNNYNASNNPADCNTVPATPPNQIPPPVPPLGLTVPPFQSQGAFDNNPFSQDIPRFNRQYNPGPPSSRNPFLRGKPGQPSFLRPLISQWNPTVNPVPPCTMQGGKPCPRHVNKPQEIPQIVKQPKYNPCQDNYANNPCGKTSKPCGGENWNNQGSNRLATKFLPTVQQQPQWPMPKSNTVTGNSTQPIMQSGKRRSSRLPSDICNDGQQFTGGCGRPVIPSSSPLPIPPLNVDFGQGSFFPSMMGAI